MSHIESFPGKIQTHTPSEQQITDWTLTQLLPAAQQQLLLINPKSQLYTPDICFKLRGLAAGKAVFDPRQQKTIIHLNRQLFDYPDNHYHELFDTLAHEMAHLVVLSAGVRQRSHGSCWQTVAQALGCTAHRCHQLKLKRTRKVDEHLYRFEQCSDDYWLGPRVHKAIQQKHAKYRIRLKSGGQIQIQAHHYTQHSRQRC